MQDIDFDIKRTNLYEVIADKLEEMITKDAEQLGEKLPSEQSLANSFGVSRNVIRESLKLLKERGLIVLRAGGGAYISKPEADILTNLIGRIVAMDGSDDLDVLAVRTLLETESCRLATIRATDEDINELEQITQRMEEVFDQHEERTKLDIQFHTRIAELTDNRLLALFVHSMVNILFALIARAIKSNLGSDSGVMYHRKIIAAMKQRDSNHASQIMHSHLEESGRRYISARDENSCEKKTGNDNK